MVAAGGEALLLPSARCRRRCWRSPCGTSLRDAGVMVTASHNPPQDNGYKVYLGDGRADRPARRRRHLGPSIAAVGPVRQVPRDGGWHVLGDDVLEAYLSSGSRPCRRAAPRDSRWCTRRCTGSAATWCSPPSSGPASPPPYVVPSQAEPDPDFPTVAFPNPEEPGAIDAGAGSGRRAAADLVIANDPDADRCAVAVPLPSGGWRMLTGDEVGVLLGDTCSVVGESDAPSRARSCRGGCSPRCARRPASGTSRP
jgi:phosphomannomutase